MRSASECKPRIVRCEAWALAGGGDAGAMQCDARRLGTQQRLEACRGVGLLVVCSASLAGVYVCVYSSSSSSSSESVGAGGWRGEGVLLSVRWVMNSVAGCGSWVGNEGVNWCKQRADLIRVGWDRTGVGLAWRSETG